MKRTAYFPVQWKPLFKSLSIYMSLVIAVPLILFIVVRFFLSGFNYDKTFEHLSLPEFSVIIFIGVPLFSVFVAFLFSQLLRITAVTIIDDKISGRNYWGLKNTIPLSDITQLTPFNSNGIRAIVVNSNYHGKVYISEHTERLDALMGVLKPFLTYEE